MVRAVLPGAIKRPLRAAHRRVTLSAALRAFRALPDGAALPQALAERLRYGWGNTGWSASADLLTAIAAAAWETKGPILECGSGLSTMLLNHIAARQDQRMVVSLEHDRAWAASMQSRVGSHVHVIAAPLMSYGEFEWYACDLLPSRIALAVCDGPPSTTRGGRFGLLPLLRGNLAPNCRILLDDCIRPAERTILERWSKMTGAPAAISAGARPYGTLVLP